MRSNIPMGEYRLPGMNEFTITVTDYTKKKKIGSLAWAEWIKSLDEAPEFDIKDGYRLVFKTMKEPEFDILMPFNNPPYELIWAQ